MTEPVEYGLSMLVLGSVVLLSRPIRQGLHRAFLLGLIGLVALGLALSATDHQTGVLSSDINEQIEYLARLGILALLLHVGLESDLGRLVLQLRCAVKIWFPDAAVSGLAAFTLILLWPGFGAVTALMPDVAEFDGVSAVIFLGILFAVTLSLQGGLNDAIWTDVELTGGLQVLKIPGVGVVPLAMALFVVLVARKMIGLRFPLRVLAELRTGRLIGANMVQRAEIYLIFMLYGLAINAWAVPQELYTAAVLAAVGTCVAGALLLTWLLGSRQREGQAV